MRKVTATNRQGLGNRLKCVLLCMTRSDAVGLHWVPNRGCNCEWANLFATRFLPPGDEQRVSNCHMTGKRALDFMFDHTPQGIRRLYLDAIARLEPVPEIARRIEEFASLTQGNVTGVSVRSWAGARESRMQGRFSLPRLLRELGLKARGSDMFVTCDSPHIFDAITARYGSRVRYVPRRAPWGERCSVAGIQDALVDLYLTGRCRRFLPSWHSSFSELQWWMGGARAEVNETMVHYYDGKQKRAHEALWGRVDPAATISPGAKRRRA